MKAIWFFIKSIYFSSKNIAMHMLTNLGKGGQFVLTTTGDMISIGLALLATLLLVSGAFLSTVAFILKSDSYTVQKEFNERGTTIDIQCEPQST